MPQYGTALPDLSGATISTAVAELLDSLDPVVTGAVVVLPDVHYPFHPSTGLVTNPDTVAAVLDWLTAAGHDDCSIGVVGTDALGGAQSASLLGYDTLAAAYDVEVIDLDLASHTTMTTTVDGKSVTLDVPDPLVGATVIAVPTVRTGPDGLVGACMTLLRAAGTDRCSPEQVAAAVDLIAPAATVVSGSYAYSGGARCSKLLLAGDDPVVLDLAVAEALGYDAAPYLAPYVAISNTALTGLDSAALAAALPTGKPRAEPTGPSPAMGAGYRLYAQLTGDGVPPMLLGEAY